MHFRQRIMLTSLAMAAVLGVAWMASAQQKTPAKPDLQRFKPVLPLDALMNGQKKLFTDAQDAMLDKAWDEAETAAWLLAEIANVNRYQKDDPEYGKLAKRVSTEAVALAKRFKKQEAQAAKDSLTRISRTCQACHDKFAKQSE